MSDLKYIVIIFGLIAIQCLTIGDHFMAKRYQAQTIAAIRDSGCSTHPRKVIEQKQIKDTYNMKGFE